jgi:uncharacterized protein (DUF4415 family)
MSKKPNPELLDDENPEWSAEDVAKARPASEALPHIFGESVAKEMLRPRGRPPVEFPKERINIRLSHDVLAHFKSAGDGWQTRIDSALRQFITEHPLGP